MNASNSSRSRWHRPRVYGTTVSLYFFVMSAIAVTYMIFFLVAALSHPPMCPVSSKGSLPCLSGLPELTVISIFSFGTIALTIAAAIMLMTQSENEWAIIAGYGALILWSILSFLFTLGSLFGSGTAYRWQLYFVVGLAMFSSNLVMYFFLTKRYSKKVLA